MVEVQAYDEPAAENVDGESISFEEEFSVNCVWKGRDVTWFLLDLRYTWVRGSGLDNQERGFIGIPDYVPVSREDRNIGIVVAVVSDRARRRRGWAQDVTPFIQLVYQSIQPRWTEEVIM